FFYDAVGGETNLPLNKTIFCRFSRMKNKNGRSALNSIGDVFGEIDAQQRIMTTAVAAAASDPK
ncbi:unnamed protein product, partial [Rotaria sordida]